MRERCVPFALPQLGPDPRELERARGTDGLPKAKGNRPRRRPRCRAKTKVGSQETTPHRIGIRSDRAEFVLGRMGFMGGPQYRGASC
jgi:hypothetical protein